MIKMTISLEGMDLKDIVLTKERTTLGRRPYNDIVIDNLAVSGEHAVFILSQGELSVEDLNSTNGTYVNGRAIRNAPVQTDDLIEIARYKIRVKDVRQEASGMAPVAHTASTHNAATEPMPLEGIARSEACIRILNGPAAGREMKLLKTSTTLGKPGVAVTAITQQAHGYEISMLEGHTPPTVNGEPIGFHPQPLCHEDVIVLAGTQMQFLLSTACP